MRLHTSANGCLPGDASGDGYASKYETPAINAALTSTSRRRSASVTAANFSTQSTPRLAGCVQLAATSAAARVKHTSRTRSLPSASSSFAVDSVDGCSAKKSACEMHQRLSNVSYSNTG